MKRLLPFPTNRLEREYNHYRRLLLAVAQRVLQDPALAEDAVQTAWLSVYKAGLPPDMPPEKWRSYLTIAVHNAAISLLRTRRHETPDEDILCETPAAAPGPAQQAEQQDSYRRLYDTLKTLPRQDQDILLLKYDNGCTVEQIAAVLALPPETVKKRLYRARQKLKQKWENLA